MVRAIVEDVGGRIFYGMREAAYHLPLASEEQRSEFATDLLKGLGKANVKLLGSSMSPLRIVSGVGNMGISHNFNQESQKDEFMKYLDKTENIWIRPLSSMRNENLLVNLISRFSDDSSSRDKSMNIVGCSIPNDIVHFNPSFLYELGEKHGELMFGEDFNISMSNYREIKK